MLALSRCVSAAYLLSADIYDANTTQATNPSFYTGFLTIHGMWLTNSYLVCAAALGLYTWRRGNGPPRPSSSSSPPSLLARLLPAWYEVHVRATQLLFVLSLCLEVVLVILYWVLLSGPKPSATAWWKDVSAHGLHLLLLLVDFFLGSNRLPDRQTLVLLSATIVYILWNIGVTFTIHWLYPVLTWTGAGSVVLALGAVLFAQGVFFACSGVSVVLRDAAAARLNGTGHRQRCCCEAVPIVSSAAAPLVANVPQKGSATEEEEEEGGAEGGPVDWSAVYPTTFRDDADAWPCSTCAPRVRRCRPEGSGRGSAVGAVGEDVAGQGGGMRTTTGSDKV